MGMLDRYKKKGGFVQLLSLMETCGKEKQEKFFKMIEDEDTTWAKAVKSKLISIQRIFTWDDNTVAEIAGTLNDITIAVASFGLDDKSKEKLFKMMDHSKKRKVDFILSEKKPNASEINSTYMQILTEVRKMISEGYIRLDKVDPELHFDSTFEDKLLQGLLIFDDGGAAPAPSAAKEASGGFDAAKEREFDALKRKVIHLSEENESLKEKLKTAESKLDQIKKIA